MNVSKPNQQREMASRPQWELKYSLKAADIISKSLLIKVSSSKLEFVDLQSLIYRKHFQTEFMDGLSIMDRLDIIVIQLVPIMGRN